MKKLIIIIIVSILTCHLSAQGLIHNLVFKSNQIELTEELKTEILNLRYRAKSGKRISIFPVVYDSIFDRYVYTSVAEKQALAISDYAQTIGFEFKGIPKNFPSAYKGRSVCVILGLKKLTDTKIFSFFPEKPSQFFIIDPRKDTVLIGNEGTKLYFNAGCLSTPNQVKVELKEYYTLGDYIKYNMPTVTNGEMIQTGGVIYLNATEEADPKKQVQIKSGIGVGVEFTNNDDPDMQLFIQDPNSNNDLNWVLPTERKDDWQMTETVFDENNNIVSKETFYSKDDWDNYLANEKQKKEISQKAQSILNTNNFGLLNCDKFIDVPTLPIEFTSDLNVYAKYYLVFTGIRGVIDGRGIQDKVVFDNTPINSEATLIAIAFKGKQAYYYNKKINTSGEKGFNIQLSPVSEVFINQQLDLLK